MKILFVFSINAGFISPFIQEQIESLSKTGINYQTYRIQGKGIKGYLNNLIKLRKTIYDYKPNLLHAHYGLAGLLAVLQRKVPVIITFHGSDIYDRKNRILSKIALCLATESIFVSKEMADIVKSKSQYIIPCGVNLEVFTPMDKKRSRDLLGLNHNIKYILFSSSFNNAVKNSRLALEAINILELQGIRCELLELKGYSRKEVSLFLNAADVALLTSFHEGSPQFIKEAMACNCPIVSTDVGDVRTILDGTDGTYLTSYEIEDIVNSLKKALDYNKRTTGRDKLGKYDNKLIIAKILEIYQKHNDKNNNS